MWIFLVWIAFLMLVCGSWAEWEHMGKWDKVWVVLVGVVLLVAGSGVLV